MPGRSRTIHQQGARRGALLLLLASTSALASCTTRLPLAPGCRGTANAGGNTEPPGHCFFFPTGLSVDPLGDLLYVTNPNADLSFAGGTLVAVNLPRQERAVACFRQLAYAAPAANLGAQVTQRCGASSCASLRAAVSADTSIEQIAALDAGIRQRGESASAYDRCYCERDTLDPNIINCESHRFVLRDQALTLGNFAGEMAVLAEDPLDWMRGSEAMLRRTLYLPVRGDPSLTYVDVRRRPVSSPDLRLRDDNPTQLTMSCGGPGRDCDPTHRVQKTPLGDELLKNPDDATVGTQPRITLPQEPFAVTLDRGCKDVGWTFSRYRDDLDRRGRPVRDDKGLPLSDSGVPRVAVPGPACEDRMQADPERRWSRRTYRTLVMTHLAPGDVSTYNLNGPPALPLPVPFTDDRPEGPGIPVLADARNLAFPTDGSGRQGAFAVAPRVPGDPSQPWYATSRLSGQLVNFRLGTDLIPPLPPPGYDEVSPERWSALSPDVQQRTRLYTPVQGPSVIPGQVFTLAGGLPMDSGGSVVDVRDMLFEPGGDRAFLVLNRPPAIAVLDTALDMQSSPPGSPRNRFLRAINIGPGPSRAALSRAPALVQGGAGPRPLRTLLYVAQFLSGELAVVDPDTGALLQSIFVGRGPVSVALNYGGEADGGHIDACADPYVSPARAGLLCPAGDPLRLPAPRAYVSAYLDNVVAVIDLDPRSPSYHRVVSRIGVPAPKSQ